MTQIFLSEIDIEILVLLAHGASVASIAAKIGKTEQTTRSRIFNLQGIFGGVTHAHLVAIAIASDVIKVQDLYDESLADGLHIRSVGDGQSYHLRSLREEIVMQAAGLN